MITEDDFWNARPWLTGIRDFSNFRMASPWAVLGGAMARAVATVPPDVRLPTGIGDAEGASLNLIVGLVAGSGGGKGLSSAVADNVVPSLHHFTRIPQGTGEGIVKSFVTRVKDKETGLWHTKQHTTNVLMEIPEVDALGAISNRNGATAMPIIRQAFSGEQLGFANATDDKRVWVDAHAYRLCLVVSIQPSRAQALLGDDAGGTPQRFLWLPASISPDTADATPTNAPALPMKSGHHRVQVSPRIQRALRNDLFRVSSGQKVINPLDAHGNLVRLKAAAALTIMDGAELVTPEMWRLAGVVMRVSTRTRQVCLDAVKADKRRDARERGRLDAERDRGRANNAAQRTRTAERVFDILKDGDEHTRSEFTQAIRSPALKDLLPEVLADFVERGEVEELHYTYNNRPSTKYRLIS